MIDIVFYGGAGAGKSTCAKYLTEAHDYTKLSIADPLKDVAHTLWGAGARKERSKLQPLGVKMREIDPDVWVNLFLEDIDSHPEGTVFVNDDCRFPNEYWALKKRGFVFVRVLSEESKRVDRLLKNGKLDDVSQLEHETETALVGLAAAREGIVDDYTIFNNDDLDDLFKQIENVLLDLEEHE